MPRAASHSRESRKPEREKASERLSTGATLYDPDHPCRRIYLVESGLIRLSSDRDAIIAHVAQGGFLGEKCFLKRGQSSQHATSVCPTTVTTFGRSQLLGRLQSDRRFALQFIKDLAFRIERYEQAICDFIAEDAQHRLARLLLRMAPAHARSGWVRLPVDPTNPELSRMVGTTRPRVSQFMRHFERSGWVRREQGLWIYLEGLREFVASSKAVRFST